jgi:DNA invertase Pin-like site-specific DNA recombinase
MISARTRSALAAAKARGTVLGNPRLADARAKANTGHQAGADAFAAKVLPIIREIKSAGAGTLRQMAQALNVRGIETARGGRWEAATVRNVMRRADS